MGLSGKLQTMPLADILQWLLTARKTGTLAVRGARYTKKLYMREGRIISSSSDDPTEQLGHFLLSHGKITEAELKKGLETQARTHVLLGKILLMVGAIKEEELKKLLSLKAEQTLFSLFLLNDAHFDFSDGELPEELFVPINLDVQDVLLKGLSMVDELRHIRHSFGSPATILGRTAKPLPAGFPPARSQAKAVLSLVDGKRSVAHICLALHASEFQVSRVMLHFIEQGYLQILKKADPEPGEGIPADRPFQSADTLISNGKERLAVGDFEAAVELLHQAMAASPRDEEVKKLYDTACKHFRDMAYRDLLPPNKIPVLVREVKDLTNENLTPEEAFLVSRINGTWDLKSIIDISPLSEVDVLRIMKRLNDRKIIQLR